MKAIICGGRDFNQSIWAFRRLDTIHKRVPIDMVIEGGAKGADRIARAWAITVCVPVLTVPAEWDRFGSSAGYKRNMKMAELGPDVVIYMPGGDGTRMMIDIAKRKGIRLINLEKVQTGAA